MLLADVARTWAEVAETSSRLAKTDLLASLLEWLSPFELPIVVTWLAGDLPQGRIGVGYATLRDAEAAPAAKPTLTVADVDAAFTAIGATSGKGSTATRAKLLHDLLAAATAAEQEFLRRLLSGDLRQGALEGVMADAIARATGTDPAAVRRAAMIRGELGAVAARAAAEGDDGLAGYGLVLFRPVQPMLAQTAEDPAAALGRLGEARFEWKIDGARVQAHRRGDEVRVYTRNLKEITDRVPEVVEAALALETDTAVLDGETIALQAGGRPHPFQLTMRRFGRKLDLDNMRQKLPLSTFWFDALHLGGRDLVDLPTTERRAALAEAAPAALVIPSLVTGDPTAAEQFLADALAAGHEGVMAKALDAPYEAGRRGAGWLKVKPAHTLDLVVLAVEWGSGRRQGWLSNIHLGARDPDGGGFVMLGKTFKGMTDEMLQWQTQRFLALETHRKGHVVYVRPEQVVEIAFDGIQASPRYPGGMALRFARVKGYRHDKGPDEADTIDAVRAIFGGGHADA